MMDTEPGPEGWVCADCGEVVRIGVMSEALSAGRPDAAIYICRFACTWIPADTWHTLSWQARSEWWRPDKTTKAKR